MTIRRSAIATASLSVFLFLSASAAQTTPWDAPPFSADPAALLEAASKIPVADRTDVEILLDDSRFVFDAQGRATTTNHLIYRVMTTAGVRNSSSVQADWEPWHEDHPEIRARVITPDRITHSLDPETIGEAPGKTSIPDVFTDSRILQAPLPAVIPGAIVEQEISVHEKAPLFERGVMRRIAFPQQIPLYRMKLTMDSPASLPLKYVTYLMPNVTPSRTNVAGRTIISFEAGPFPRAPRLNPYIPSNVPSRPMIAFTTGRTWKEIASRYSEIVDQQIAQANVSSLIGDFAGAPREKVIERLLSRLQQEVRYTGIEFGEASFIPRNPNETLQRKYGDCKDQAAVLVAMLRRSGIPAYLALVSTAPSTDVDADLPGLGGFTHAIVYAPGAPALWIDPTYEFARAGQLPPSVQGRFALIVRPETDGLVRTPESASADNKSLETREFILAELGPAQVTETTEVSGTHEQRLRSYYAGLDAAATRTDLDRYMKQYYTADALSNFEISVPADMSRPFRMRLEAAKAQRGMTGISEAAVAIPALPILSAVTDFTESLDPKSELTIGNATELVLPEPSITEWRYRIVPPPGFAPRALPSSETRRLGHAAFSRQFEKDNDGVITATIRFDTGKRTFSLAEAAELRDAASKLDDLAQVVITFEQVGQSFLEDGKVREALGEFRKLTTAHPNEALHHAQIAKALLAGGIGYAAREEAQRAVALEPSSSVAYATLGFVLEHDLIGRQFGKGFDMRGAETAYRKAKELDPANLTARAQLAILLEHNVKGIRYAQDGKLNEAIAEYREIQDELGDGPLADNLPIALLHAGRYAEAREAMQALSLTPQRQSIIVAAIAAKDGVDAAQREVTRIASTDEARRQVLAGASETLLRLRRYPESAQLMTTAARGSRQAAELIGRAALIKEMRRYEDLKFSPTDPTTVVQRMFVELLSNESAVEGLKPILSRHLIPGLTRAEDADEIRSVGVMLRGRFTAAGLPREVVLDLLLAALEFNAEGDNQNGFKLRTAAGPAGQSTFYVTRENGEYRLLGMYDSFEYVGKEVLARVENGELDVARHWLDWVRADQPLAGGDDPFAGLPFARFWEKGKKGTVDEIRYAAASLLSHASDAPEAIDILNQGRTRATSDTARNNFDLALAHALTESNRFEDLLPVAQRLYRAVPHSDYAFNALVNALEALNRLKEAEQIAQRRLDGNSDDDQAIRVLARLASTQNDLAKSQTLKKRLVVLGKAQPMDLNDLAWDALVLDAVIPEAIRTAQQAVQARSNSAAALHTLASLYAEVGEAAQARDLLIQSIQVRGQEEPSVEDWYVLGRIAEQFGVNDAAIGAYNKVPKPKQEREMPGSVYLLAQRRLSAIAKNEAR